MDEDELGAALRRMLSRTDPVPETAYRAAVGALAWRDIDGQFARLVSEVGAIEQLAHVRGEPPRMLTFDSGAISVVLEVSAVDGAVTLLGQLEPPGVAEVRIQSPDGTRTARTDARGRFSVEDLPGGWTRLAVAYEPPGGARGTTEWFHA